MAKRRGAGEGGVYQRGDGLWVCSVELGRTSGGQRRRKYVSGKTKAAAIAKRDEVMRTIAAGLPVLDDQRTVADFLAWWLAEVLPGSGVKAGTVTSYGDVVRCYVVPHVGAVRLSKLSPEHVHHMMRDLERAGRSPRTRNYARKVLARALADALRWDLVHRNAAALVKGPPKAATKLDDAMDAAQARAVLGAAKGDRLEALARLVLTLGLRKGEALALRWSALDLDAPGGPVLHVRGTLSRRPGEGLVIEPPKTKAGERTIPLISGCASALREHRRRQAVERLAAGPAWEDTGHVFTTEAGTPLDPSNALRWWHGLTERAGVGRRRFHASRHTAATLLLDQGVPLEVVSAILGHAGLAITADVYARVTQDSKRRALSTLSDPLAL